MPRPPTWAALLLWAASACALRPRSGEGGRITTVEAQGQRVEIQFQPEDAAAAALVAEGVREGLPRLARYARLRATVTISIRPTRESLEAVAGGYYWLRAWAQYATIDLLSPRAWAWQGIEAEPPDAARVKQLVLHELTHCAMYQAAASEWTWNVKGIPAWFREGMASVLAGEGARRLPIREVWRALAREEPPPGGGWRPPGDPLPGGDPLSDPGPLYADESELVYGTAHQAFAFLVRRYGDERIRQVLARMGSGAFFAAAFREAIGLEPAAFEAEFRRYVLWRGWDADPDSP